MIVGTLSWEISSTPSADSIVLKGNANGESTPGNKYISINYSFGGQGYPSGIEAPLSPI